MQQINRNQAEEIFRKSNVVDTKINQTNKELCLIFNLENGELLQMNYKLPEGEKTYYLIKHFHNIQN